MRYLAIIALFFIGCRAVNTGTGGAAPDLSLHNNGLFTIIVQYNEQHTEDIILKVLNTRGVLLGFTVRHPNIYVSEIEATCQNANYTNTNALYEELRQTAGVSHVVFNPR